MKSNKCEYPNRGHVERQVNINGVVFVGCEKIFATMSGKKDFSSHDNSHFFRQKLCFRFIYVFFSFQ